MNILVAPTESMILGETTTFAEEEAVGQTVLTVENAQGFSANEYIILGLRGTETAEIRKIASTTDTTITISVATSFKHEKNAPVQMIRFNQRKFYRSSSEDGTYSHLSTEGSPVDIGVDTPEGTEFEDTIGGETSWYKATYYNVYTGLESSLSDAIATRAGEIDHYTSIFKIKEEAGFKNNTFIDSILVDRYRTEAEAIAESTIAIIYQVPLASAPSIFQHIITLYAAGLLLLKEYSVDNDADTTKNGQKKIDRAEELLMKIANSEIVLLNSSSDEISRQTTNLASCSNIYNSNKYDKGELFTTQDENFRMANPETGDGNTDK